MVVLGHTRQIRDGGNGTRPHAHTFPSRSGGILVLPRSWVAVLGTVGTLVLAVPCAMVEGQRTGRAGALVLPHERSCKHLHDRTSLQENVGISCGCPRALHSEAEALDSEAEALDSEAEALDSAAEHLDLGHHVGTGIQIRGRISLVKSDGKCCPLSPATHWVKGQMLDDALGQVALANVVLGALQHHARTDTQVRDRISPRGSAGK